jgi:hypothetical protein
MYILNHGVNTGVPEWTTLTTLVHVHLKSLGKQMYSVVLVLFFLEDLRLQSDFERTFINGVRVVHSGVHVFTP